jgi:hypothetical protein
MCVANKMINGHQCTICWHVDDLKISHVSQEVLEDIIRQLEAKYGAMTITRGNKHVYVGMNIIYNEDRTVTIDMVDYVKETIAEFPDNKEKTSITPAAAYLFEVDEECEKLCSEKSVLFHKLVAKLLFLSKRGRPDIQLAIAFLCTRTTKSDEDDWKKLSRVIQYLRGTIDMTLTLSADHMHVIKWWVDASYAVHENMRSHTGASMSLGRGMIYCKSSKQKLNTKSSTEAEVVATSDMLGQMLWTLYFLQGQGYDVMTKDTPKKIANKLYQDNTSAIRLQENGKMSSSQRTRHINIRYFFIKDKIEKEEVSIVYCPTEDMVADYFTKPLQGKQFTRFRDIIMGIVDNMSEERVEENSTEHVTTHMGVNGTDYMNGKKQTNIAQTNIISDDKKV